jgi:hypothetical protein
MLKLAELIKKKKMLIGEMRLQTGIEVLQDVRKSWKN